MRYILFCSCLFSSVLFAAPEFKPQTVISDYNSARETYFWKQLYTDGGETLYCASTFPAGEKESIEHIYPADWIAEFNDCPDRKNCNKTPYKRAEADLHNLWPALGRINSSRGDNPYGEISDDILGTNRFQDICEDYERTYGSNPMVEPRDIVKGKIARSLFYMSMTYDLPLGDMQDMLVRWHTKYPVTPAEEKRNTKIKSIQGTENHFISQPQLVYELFGSGSSQLRLASWNIYWLVSDDEFNIRKNTDYKGLQDIAALLDADVIALQEIENAKYAKRVFGDAYEYHFTNRKPGESTQRVGFAIKKSANITVSATDDYTALDVGGVRYGMDITIERNNQSLRLLGVHLKSGCFATPLDKATLDGMPAETYSDKKRKRACEMLKKQIRPLERWVDKRAEENIPFIVLGDFNRRLEVEDENGYKESQGIWPALDDPRSKNPNQNMTRINDDIQPQCWPGVFNDFIDHIIADPRAAEMIVSDSFDELRYEDKQYQSSYKLLSDHCPICVDIAM